MIVEVADLAWDKENCSKGATDIVDILPDRPTEPNGILYVHKKEAAWFGR